MKRRFFTINLLLVLVLFAGASNSAGQQGPVDKITAKEAPVSIEATVASKISYQGVLREGGSLVSGARNMVFEFWDNSTCIGATPSFLVSKPGVVVSNGLFSVALDVPPDRFGGVAYWLRVRVGGTALGCQELLPAPYALTLRPGATISALNTALTLESNSGTALEAATRTTAGGTVAAITGRSTATSGGKAGVLGEIASRSDWVVGVWGRATGTSGVTSGVWGQTESTSNGARGVTGWAHGTSGITYGVRGDSESPVGMGVAGYANATTGRTYGVYGEIASRSDYAEAVLGRAMAQSGITSGVWGQTESTTDGARGVTGWAHGASGATVGVRGDSESPAGMGVLGVAGATGGPAVGVRGEVRSPSGSGVSGVAFAPTGVNNGVIGVTFSNTDEARGVVGWAPAGSGETYGVFGLSYSSLGRGVYGLASAGSGDTIGVYGESYSPTGTGVAGRANSGWAGAFNSSSGNGVWISAAAGKTGLVVAGGSKSAVVPTQDGNRLLYTEESTEVWFTDYGFGQLTGGKAQVAIDPIFSQTVNLDEPYHVFVQVYGDADVYVTNRTTAGFEVRLSEGNPIAEFSYRIVAKRLGFETQRLEPAPWADIESNLHPQQQISAPNLLPPLVPNMP